MYGDAYGYKQWGYQHRMTLSDGDVYGDAGDDDNPELALRGRGTQYPLNLKGH